MGETPRRINDLLPRGHIVGEAASKAARKTKQRKNKVKIVVSAILIFLAVVGISIGGWQLSRIGTDATLGIDSSKYQAVFFTNGQVYFGKLQTVNGNNMKLTKVFYLQAESTTSASATTAIQQSSTDASSGVQLIKLGNEVHGPEDEMVINRDQILFFENLKSDSKVVQSIGTYQTQE